MDPKLLYDFGLTDAEARIYLALLQAGRSKSGAIIKATGLQSSTVYNALPSLSQKGLVSTVLIGKTKHFSASPPESFLNFMEERKRRFSEVLPRLKLMEATGASEHKSAKVFEGIKGLRAAFNDVYLSMEPGEEYCFFQMATEDLRKKRIFSFFRSWHLRRSGKGIRAKGLALPPAREIQKDIFRGVPHTRLRFVSDFLPTGMVVYKDKLLLVDFSDSPFGFQIKSQKVANSFRGFFDAKWKAAGN